MSHAYKVFDRMMTMKTYYGSADKEAMMSIDADPLDQQVFPFDHGRLDHFNDGASSYITSSGLYSRLSRDLAMDIRNPRQELPKNPSDTRPMDIIPNLVPQQPDMSNPADYESSVAVNLYRQAKRNHRNQDNLFIDKKAQQAGAMGGQNNYDYKGGRLNGNKGSGGGSVSGRKFTNSDTWGITPLEGLGALELYSHEGNAAGVHMNRLATDEDDAYLNSIESMSAF